MSGFYPVENVNTDMSFVQQCIREPVNEGALTDEYIVNLMDEIRVNSPTPYDYQPMKLYDQIHDFMTVPQIEISQDQEETLYPGMYCPATPSNSEVSEQSLLSPASSSMTAPSPAGSFYESDSSMMPSYSHLPLSVAMHDALPTPLFSEEATVDQQTPIKKRRGRKPKSVAGGAGGPEGHQKKSKRVKVYEISAPFNDKEQERRRLNAVNAKRHRDLQKQEKKSLEQQLADAIIERDILKQKNDEMESRMAMMSQQLEQFQNYFGIQTVPVFTLPPEEHLPQ